MHKKGPILAGCTLGVLERVLTLIFMIYGINNENNYIIYAKYYNIIIIQ